MRNKLLVTIGIIALAFSAVMGIKFLAAPKFSTVDSNPMRTKGNPAAKVHVIEFVDFQCPACAHGMGQLNDYFKKYPNDIKIQLKYYPLVKPHAHAMTSALYAECAAQQGKFWLFVEMMFARQQQWSSLISAEPLFVEMAKEAGVNTTELRTCLAAESTTKAIHDDKTLGDSLAVQSTPTYFINNKMVVGAKSLQDELKTLFSRTIMFAAIRIVIGLIFLLSGFEKSTNPYQNFLYIVQAYQMLPNPLETAVAVIMPWLELFVGLFLVLGLWTKQALTMSLLLFTTFIIVVAQALLRGLPLEQCGCFGSWIHIPPATMVLLDSMFLLLNFLLLRYPQKAAAFSLDKTFLR